VVEINDYNLAIELQAWLDDERQHIEKRFALREAAFKALVAANIEMPLETIQLAPHKIEVNKSLLPTESNT
jgi:small conductance mechanosensitive channel